MALELFKLFGTIALDNSEANQGIDETTDKAEKAHPKISAAFEKIGTAAVKVGKVMATGLAAGSAAIVALAKQSLDSYAEYEQLIGGTELMFGEGFDFIAEKAKTAYKDVQMSQNEYLTQVNGFAVGLKTALGGNEQAAAELADKIITAEADIIAATGNTQESVQNAFNGIMKSNFTMLDNLGLGITPTKEGFQEVIDKVNEWNKANGKATSYMIDNLADCQAALVDYVEMQGMAGYAANESAQTIQGSLSSMKSAWNNLLTGFADDSQDLNALVKNLADSATTVVQNIVPRIAQILSGISSALPQIMPVIAAELPLMMEALLPGLIDGAVALAVGLAQMVPSLLEMVFIDLPQLLSEALYNSSSPAVSSLGSLFLDIGEFWREVLLPAISGVGQALGGLWNAVQPILAIFPQLFTETTCITSGFDIFRNVCFLVEAALQIVSEKITEVANWISDHSEEIKEIIRNLWEEVQSVWNNVGKPIWDAVSECIGIVRDAFAERMPAIKEFVSGCFGDIKDFWTNHLKPCFEAIASFIKDNLAPVFENVFNNIMNVVDNVFSIIKNLWTHTLKPVFVGIVDFITGVFSGDWKKAWNGIVNVFKGIINIIPTALEAVVNGAITLVNGLISGINKIASKVGLGEIRLISKVSIPKLEKGGILEKGQVGLLEGNGAEAVVPLDQNQAWISAVAKDMKASGIGGQSEVLVSYMQQLIDMLADYFPQLVEASGHDIVTNDGVIVAHYGPLMNAELGKISARKDRGR